MPWNRMKPTMFFSWLFYDNEKAIEELFFIVSEFMGFSWGFLNSMPHKKTMSFQWTVEY